MPYRDKPAAKQWRSKRLPGGCFSLFTVVGMVASVVAAAGLGFDRFAGPDTLVAAVAVSGVLGVAAGVGFLWFVSRLERVIAAHTPMSGQLVLEGSDLSVRVPGLGNRRLRFDVEREVTLRAASYEDADWGAQTCVVIRRGDDVAVCTSSGSLAGWSGRLRVETQRFELPPDVPKLELEHAALEDLLQSIDERIGLR